MAQIETYRAVADADIALAIAGVTSPFNIEVRFLGGLTQRQMDAFKGAADRWTRLIVGDLPSFLVDGEVVDDVLILAQGEDIDGPGGVLGQAGSTALRPASANFLPAKGVMSFDQADLEEMEDNGTLNDVITHEMGHVLGIGRRLWQLRGFLTGAGTDNPVFTGAGAMEEYARLRGGGAGATPVPVANVGGTGTRDTHWREMVFINELMTGTIRDAGNPISRMTVASLRDLGYTVDMNAAEPYELPDLLAMAEEGLLIANDALVNVGIMLPTVPIILPEENLQ
jgi:Leishmanolysin